MKLTGPSLSEIPRHELIAAALELGIERSEQLTLEQLREKIRAASAGATKAELSLGRVLLFSVARNLIALVVERGLNLLDAARVIRDTVRLFPRYRSLLPTVTLAQIYLAQGYTDRAVQTLTQIIEREPNNYTAVELYQRLTRVRDEHNGRSAAESAPNPNVEHASIAPGLAPRSELWYVPGEPITRGLRDALVLLEREPRQITVYWELSERHAAQLDTHPSEIRIHCYGGTDEPREVVVPLHAAFGWAVVELLDDEVPCACLTVSGRVVATALRARLLEAPDAARAEVVFTARSRAFWNDVVERSVQ